MPSLSILKSSTRAALFGTTALVASASGAQAIDYIVNATETSTFILGLGTADSLTINGSGEITTVSPGVAVIDLADSITIQSTGVTAEIDADAVGIEVQGATADLTGGISIASGAIVTAVTTGGTSGTGILVHTSADISGGINNSGAITGFDNGVAVGSNASISGGVVNTGSIFGNDAAIIVGSSPTDSSTMGAITNNGSGVIGINGANSSVADRGIFVGGSGSDITGLITNSATATIVGGSAAIHVASGGDISGGITNAGMIGQATTTGGPVTANVAIAVTSGGDISGTITNSGTIVGDMAAIFVSSASISGGIVNSGDLIGGGGGLDAAILVGAATLGSTANIGIANQTGGVISGNSAIDINTGSTVYGITNSGEIFGTGGTGAAINARSSQFNGDITNNTGGVIGANAAGTVADARGIYFSNTNSTGGINNSGNIAGSSVGIYLVSSSTLTGAITNATSGSIGLFTGATSTVSAATGIHVRLGSSVAGGIVNSGSINGTSIGVRLGEDASVGTAATTSAMAIAGIMNNASAVISGGAVGINVNSSTVLGGISNSGNIYGATAGIYIENGADVAGITNTNTGVIGQQTGAGSIANNGIQLEGAGTTVSGDIDNSGTIAGALVAIRVSSAASVVGNIINDGMIGVTAPGGSVAATAGIQLGSLASMTGDITNSGTIFGGADGIQIIGASNFTGNITNNSGGLIGVTVSGAAATYAGINISAGSEVTGTITNSGTIFGAQYGISVLSSLGTGINNMGLIGVTSSSARAANAGILLGGGGTNSLSGGITNSGTIFGGTIGIQIMAGSSIAGDITNTGVIGLTSLGVMATSAGIRVNSGAHVTGNIENSGTIVGGQYGVIINQGGDIGGINNTGLIGVTASGAAASSAGILLASGPSLTSGITNTGTIFGDQYAIRAYNGAGIGTLTNNTDGLIGVTASGATATVGIYVASGASISTLTNNDGVIAGQIAAIQVESGGSITAGINNTAGGSILGQVYGIEIAAGGSLSGGISNNGLIEGRANSAIYIESTNVNGDITNDDRMEGGTIGVHLDGGTLTGSLINNGTIEGGTDGIRLESSATITGTITNNSGGVIEGYDYGIRIDTSSNVVGGISNAGTILSDTSSGTGILVTATSTVGSITNSGSIQGGTESSGYGIYVSTGSSVTSITNSGTIKGDTAAIQFGNSDSTLTLQTGSLLRGDVDGGTGINDTLVLEGYGWENSRFTNFEHLTVSASTSGTWVLVGNSNFDDLTVNSGTLEVRGTVVVTTATVAGGTLNVSSGGSLTATTVTVTEDLDVEGTIVATTVTVAGTLSGSGTITGALTVNGILSPGNSPGQLNVVGAFVEGNNSSYLVEHLPGNTPETDIVVVTGAATIGTNVDVNVVVAAGTDGFEDDILTATAGITGTYDDVNLLDDNLVALIAYPDANTATLLVAKTDALAATAATVSDAGFVFLDNLQEGARRDGRVWATAYIYSAENEGLGQDGADYDQDAFGFNAGVDVISQPNLKVGLAVGYIDGDIDIDSATSDAENDGIFGAAYLNYMNDNFYLDGAIMIGQQTVDTTRTLTAGTATASIDATSYGANLEAGFELEALGGRLSPFVKVGIHSASLDAYSESGAAGAMRVGEVETQQMRVGGGFRYAVDLGSADGIQVTPAIKVGMTQEWQDGDSSADIGFVGYTGSTTAALDFQDQTTVDLGISFDVKLSQAVTAFVGWDAALGDETTRNTGTIGLSVNW